MEVRKYRTQLNLSQGQLAIATGIPRNRIAQWEARKANPKAKDEQTLREFFRKNGIRDIPEVSYAKDFNIDDFIKIPYLPFYAYNSYIKHYSKKGKEADRDLDYVIVEEDDDENITSKGSYMVIEVTDNSMNNKTEKAICAEDKLFIEEIEITKWKKGKIDYKRNIFILFTIHHGMLCRQIIKFNLDNGFFTCHAWNRSHPDIEIRINEIERLYYVKNIFNRKFTL